MIASKLKVQCPVPSDIQIAQSIEPLHISKIAEREGILDEELHLFGRYKAKVGLDILQRFFFFLYYC